MESIYSIRNKSFKNYFKIKRLLKKGTCIVSLLLVFISIFSFNVHAQDSEKLLKEVRSLIKENYIDEVPDSVLNSSTINDIVKGLNDPYSQYFSKQEEEDFLNSIDNKTYGIGIYMDIVKEGVKIDSVIGGSPAETAGLKEGDIIFSADNHSLVGVNSKQASSYIKGTKGTSVKLSVKRGDATLNFDVKRGEISVPTVNAKMLDNGTAYIDIVSFGGDTSQLFSKKLKELKGKNPERYIIDLRDNGGGYMETALDIAGNFIGKNLAMIVEDKSGKRVGYLAEDKGGVIDKPMIFLVNNYTASASEILSSAVKDYKKAVFIGNTTYGKGVAQRIFTLSNGSALKLTFEKFYSPKGNQIQKVGIKPDFDTKTVNSLVIAELFSGKCRNEIDKSGFVKILIGEKEFEIDLNVAKSEKYWSAFKYIINNVDRSNIYVGKKDGWVKAPEEYFNNIYKFFYSDYKELETSKEISEDKVFTVTFNKSINSSTIKDNTGIEIINDYNGKRIAFEVNSIDDKKITLTPKERLEAGQTYHIKIKDLIKSFTVKN